MAYSRLRPRRGTAYEWSTINPVLESGEWGVEVPDTGIGTGFSKFKIGNGSDAWNDLEYAFDGTAAASIDGGTVSEFHVIKLRAGSHSLWADLNPILNKNEIAYDIDKNAVKVGNGEDAWNDLPYMNSGSLIDDEFDFGSEDDDEVIYGLNNKALVEGKVEDLDYPESVFDLNEKYSPDETTDPEEPTDDEPGATIDDLIPDETTDPEENSGD